MTPEEIEKRFAELSSKVRSTSLTAKAVPSSFSIAKLEALAEFAIAIGEYITFMESIMHQSLNEPHN